MPDRQSIYVHWVYRQPQLASESLSNKPEVEGGLKLDYNSKACVLSPLNFIWCSKKLPDTVKHHPCPNFRKLKLKQSYPRKKCDLNKMSSRTPPTPTILTSTFHVPRSESFPSFQPQPCALRVPGQWYLIQNYAPSSFSLNFHSFRFSIKQLSINNNVLLYHFRNICNLYHDTFGQNPTLLPPRSLQKEF